MNNNTMGLKGFNQGELIEFHLEDRILKYAVCSNHLSGRECINDDIFKVLGINKRKFAENVYHRTDVIGGVFPEWCNEVEKEAMLQNLNKKIAEYNKDYFDDLYFGRVEFKYCGKIYRYEISRTYLQNTTTPLNNAAIFDVLGIKDKNEVCKAVYQYPILKGTEDNSFPEFPENDRISCMRIIEFLASKCDETKIYNKVGVEVKTITKSSRHSIREEYSSSVISEQEKTEIDETTKLKLPNKTKQFKFKNIF